MEDVAKKLKKRAKIRKAMGSIKGVNVGKEISSTIKSTSAASSYVPTIKKVKEVDISKTKSAAVNNVPSVSKQSKIKYEQSGKAMEGKISDILNKLKIGSKVRGVKNLNEKDRSEIIDSADSIDDEGRYYKKKKDKK